MDYDDWLMVAATAGIDWVNDPPPKEFLTEELVIAALNDSPLDLAKIPEELKTFDVCYCAVYQDDEALEAVPEKSREQVKAKKDAISELRWLTELSAYTGNHYIKLTKKLLRPDFLRQMVEQNGVTIELVPDEFITPKLQAIADEVGDKNWLQMAREKAKRDKP